jgi:hypothetical protein
MARRLSENALFPQLFALPALPSVVIFLKIMLGILSVYCARRKCPWGMLYLQKMPQSEKKLLFSDNLLSVKKSMLPE